MQIIDTEVISKIISEYPNSIFIPGKQEVDLDNEFYTVYVVENLIHGKSSKRVDVSQLEIVFDKKNAGALEGHYLRFYGEARKVKSLEKILRLRIENSNYFFSKDFQNAIIFDLENKILIEAQLRDKNFYASHLLAQRTLPNNSFTNAKNLAERNFITFNGKQSFFSRKSGTALQKLLREYQEAKARIN